MEIDNRQDKDRVQDGNGSPNHPKRRLRWGRVFLLLIVLAVLLTTVFWGSVWVYNHVIHAPKTETVAADDTIGKDEMLNKRINVLLLGIDDGDSEAEATEPKRTDAMIIASFDPEDHKISLISLPRDTMVQLPGHNGFEKLNSAYAYGGVAMAKQSIANLLRIPIHYYALLNWQGFIEVIDLIGGVDLYVDKDMHYEDPYANLKIDIKHGYQHLDGERSGQYVRFRTDELGDIGRVQRQQKFLKALGLQMFSVDNIAKIPKILATLKDHVETDMDTVTLLKAARSFNILSENRIRSGMLYGNFYDSPRTGISYWRTTRPEIEKSLEEVDIPFRKTQEGNDASDPVSGAENVEARGFGSEQGKTDRTNQRKAVSEDDVKKLDRKKQEEAKEDTAAEKRKSKESSGSEGSPSASPAEKVKKPAAKPTTPAVRTPIKVGNTPQPAAN